MLALEKNCVVVKGKTKDESKCVSNKCKNMEDCKKIFGKDLKYECMNGTCEMSGEYDDEYGFYDEEV